MKRYKKNSRVFCPVDYEKWQTVLQPDVGLPFDDGIYAIHLWNEMWRLAGQDKNAQYHERCLYEKLKELTCQPLLPCPVSPSSNNIPMRSGFIYNDAVAIGF